MAEPRPLLVLLMGLPGCGKSTLARALAPALDLPVVDRDAIRLAMFPDSDPKVGEKSAATGAVWLAVRALLEAGQGCVIDGMTFASAAERAYAQGLADAFGARCVQIAVVVSQRLAMERVRHQSHPSKERGPALVRRVAARFAPLDAGVLQLDGRDPVEQQLQQVLASI